VRQGMNAVEARNLAVFIVLAAMLFLWLLGVLP
jgi:hypothetical protein